MNTQQIAKASEQALIDYLANFNIFAVAGKHSHYKHVNVVAWGFIRIEVKRLVLDTRQNVNYYYAGNTPKQVKNGYNADVVCLIIDNDFYFFKPSHPAFFNDSGERLKTKVLYTPVGGVRHKAKSVQFTPRDFKNAQDALHLIDNLLMKYQNG